MDKSQRRKQHKKNQKARHLENKRRGDHFLHSWNEMNHSAATQDPNFLSVLNSFHADVDQHAAKNRLNAVLNDAPFTDNVERSHAIQFLMQSFQDRHYQDKDGQPLMIQIWGLPVTGDIRQLLAVAHDAGFFADHVSKRFAKATTYPLIMMPVHALWSLSPQVMWDIQYELAQSVDDPLERLKNLGDKLTPFSIHAHVDANHIMENPDQGYVGSAVLWMVSYIKDVGDEQLDIDNIWYDEYKNWRQQNGHTHILPSPLMPLISSVVQSSIQHIEFEWGKNSTLNRKIIEIDQIALKHTTNAVQAEAYIGDALFAITQVPLSIGVWVLDAMVKEWSKRDIRILFS